MADDDFDAIQDTPEWAGKLEEEWRCTDTEAQQILDILFGRYDYEQAWEDELIDRNTYYRLENYSSRGEKALALIDAIPDLGDGCHGVEAIDTDPHNIQHKAEAYYLNTGDTYSTTILYDTDECRFLLTTWGDFYQALEQQAMEDAEPPSDYDLRFPEFEVDRTQRVGAGRWLVWHELEWPGDYEDYPDAGYVTYCVRPDAGPDYPNFLHYKTLEEVPEDYRSCFERCSDLQGRVTQALEVEGAEFKIDFVPEQERKDA